MDCHLNLPRVGPEVRPQNQACYQRRNFEVYECSPNSTWDQFYFTGNQRTKNIFSFLLFILLTQLLLFHLNIKIITFIIWMFILHCFHIYTFLFTTTSFIYYIFHFILFIFILIAIYYKSVSHSYRFR